MDVDLHIDLCRYFDEYLQRQEQEEERKTLSLLVGGAAFEAWLAFETRLITERRRSELGLEAELDDGGNPVPRYMICNERKKVDFSIIDLKDSELELALEFKLIHNNKNWKSKAGEVWADVFPGDGNKAAMRPRSGRYAVVGIVGLVYREPGDSYPGQVSDLKEWEEKLDDYLLPDDGYEGNKLTRLWSGKRFPVEDPWLRKDAGSFFQLQLLGPE